MERNIIVKLTFGNTRLNPAQKIRHIPVPNPARTTHHRGRLQNANPPKIQQGYRLIVHRKTHHYKIFKFPTSQAYTRGKEGEGT